MGRCVSNVWVQAKTHTYRDTLKRAKSSTKWLPNYQYVLRGDNICNLQQKLALNSRDGRIFMCGMFWMCDKKPKHTPQGTHSRAQKLARLHLLALSMCWRVMISVICNKNELRIQEMSQFLCVGCVGCVLAVRVQGKKHTSRGTPKSAKSSTKWLPSYQYVLKGNDICNLQQKLAHNSRD